ncbi:MAG: Gfo/Idh/MocA family protein [Planctomycetota bacterium]
MNDSSTNSQRLRAGMVGMGMIFDETYGPFFESARAHGLHDRRFGVVEVELAAVASRTGRRAEAYRRSAPPTMREFHSFVEPNCTAQLLETGVDFVCVATPDDRHFDTAKTVLESGRHVLIEKPSVLSLNQLDQLQELARRKGVLAKVVYHKLFDPDHKRLRTLVVDDQLKHVNSGYCTLLEPKQISGKQFAEWIVGRNPGTYVAVHYIKLIDFTFGGSLHSVTATGQRGLVDDPRGKTWDSVQMRLVYHYHDGREGAFDIHTSWVTPDNFPGYVEQEVQFRFDNGVWNGHGRWRGVECTIEGQTPHAMKISLNNHYNGAFLEPTGERTRRGYGIEVLEEFAREVAYVQLGGGNEERAKRLEEMRRLDHNDLEADRQVVAAVQALEAILREHVRGTPDCVARVNEPSAGLVLYRPGSGEGEVLYQPRI